MPAVDLVYDLDGFPFGGSYAETGYLVQDFDPGQVDIIANDEPFPRQDGVRFGRDYRGGRLLTFDILLMQGSGTGADTLDAFGRLSSVWDADMVRATPGAVSILRMTRAGRTRRVYGRPRRFAPKSERNQFGWLNVLADFQAMDGLFYSDAELSTVIGMSAPSVGGLVGPLIGPIDAESAGEGVQAVFVGGDKPAWLGLRIRGPIVDPEIEVVGAWKIKMNVTLASDDWVMIDPSPWNRGVRRANGANLAGAFTADSQRLSQMRIPTGSQQILLRGTDITGSASVQAYVREAYSFY